MRRCSSCDHDVKVGWFWHGDVVDAAAVELLEYLNFRREQVAVLARRRLVRAQLAGLLVSCEDAEVLLQAVDVLQLAQQLALRIETVLLEVFLALARRQPEALLVAQVQRLAHESVPAFGERGVHGRCVARQQRGL